MCSAAADILWPQLAAVHARAEPKPLQRDSTQCCRASKAVVVRYYGPEDLRKAEAPYFMMAEKAGQRFPSAGGQCSSASATAGDLRPDRKAAGTCYEGLAACVVFEIRQGTGLSSMSILNTAPSKGDFAYRPLDSGGHDLLWGYSTSHHTGFLLLLPDYI